MGGKVKTELCGWRVARAVLEIIEGNSDMTTIAHKYGYSSSSHFSAEVKSRLGKTPRELCKSYENKIMHYYYINFSLMHFNGLLTHGAYAATANGYVANKENLRSF